jgi:hypothetical protein
MNPKSKCKHEKFVTDVFGNAEGECAGCGLLKTTIEAISAKQEAGCGLNECDHPNCITLKEGSVVTMEVGQSAGGNGTIDKETGKPVYEMIVETGEDWEEEYNKKFYSNTDKTCTWHRNFELKSFICSQISRAKAEGYELGHSEATKGVHKAISEAKAEGDYSGWKQGFKKGVERCLEEIPDTWYPHGDNYSGYNVEGLKDKLKKLIIKN